MDKLMFVNQDDKFLIILVSVIEARYPHYPTIYRSKKPKDVYSYKSAKTLKQKPTTVKYYWGTPILEYPSVKFPKPVENTNDRKNSTETDCPDGKFCEKDAAEVEEENKTTEVKKTLIDKNHTNKSLINEVEKSQNNGSCTNTLKSYPSDSNQTSYDNDKSTVIETTTNLTHLEIEDTTLKSEIDIDGNL